MVAQGVFNGDAVLAQGKVNHNGKVVVGVEILRIEGGWEGSKLKKAPIGDAVCKLVGGVLVDATCFVAEEGVEAGGGVI